MLQKALLVEGVAEGKFGLTEYSVLCTSDASSHHCDAVNSCKKGFYLSLKARDVIRQ